LALLEQAETLFRRQGQQHWADWLRRDYTHIAGRDAYGLHHLLQAFGGMGSIVDQPADTELSHLLSRIYASARSLLDEYNKP
jgi:hypothetical protein